MLKLVRIPDERYADYRLEAIFSAYKWDPQVGDHNTVANHALLIDRQTLAQLEQWTTQLAAETVALEHALVARPQIDAPLGLPMARKVLMRMRDYQPERHVRVMRFDFHPTTDGGWAISEVNSDVPGGFAESSVLPRVASRYLDIPTTTCGDSVASLHQALTARVSPQGTLALVHATAYSDDRQVMQCIGDYCSQRGMRVLYLAPDHIRWRDRHAVSIAEGASGDIDAMVRFFPLEWLMEMPRGTDWRCFYDTVTTSANHPIAIYAQAKRLPLLWDQLGVPIPTWRQLLPQTLDPGDPRVNESEFIFKPNFGRVGEAIGIREVISDKEYRLICRAARKDRLGWLAQRRFASQPLLDTDGQPCHICVGAFAIDGRPAGLYGRLSPYARVDSNARDIPILCVDNPVDDRPEEAK